MLENNPVSNLWARRIIEMWKFYKGLRGDNMRRTGDSAYIGSGGKSESGINTDWRPRQFRVKSEENDYLVCVPYNSEAETAGDKEFKVAKHPSNRGDTVLRGTRSGYIADETVVWAAPFRFNGAVDGDDNQVTLMEIFPPDSHTYFAKVTDSSSGTADITLEELDSAGDAITDGRAPTDAKTLDSRKGVPVDTLGLAFELPPTTAGGDIVTKFVYQQPGTFGIKLTQTGGTAGDSTTQCSFTYTVDDMLDNELATAVDPTSSPHLWQRPTVGLMLAATSGVATLETGELVILSINEMINFEECGS